MKPDEGDRNGSKKEITRKTPTKDHTTQNGIIKASTK